MAGGVGASQIPGTGSEQLDPCVHSSLGHSLTPLPEEIKGFWDIPAFSHHHFHNTMGTLHKAKAAIELLTPSSLQPC